MILRNRQSKVQQVKLLYLVGVLYVSVPNVIHKKATLNLTNS